MKQIKELLENFNIKSPSGKDKWDCKTINNLLSNEKYIGNVFQQKTFVSDALTGKREQILDKSKKSILRIIMISKEYFEKVQKFKKMRSRCIFDEKGNKVIRHNQYRSKSIYSNVLVCGYCGAPYRRRTERGEIVYRCATRMDKGRGKCPYSITLKENDVNEIIAQEKNSRNFDEDFEHIGRVEV